MKSLYIAPSKHNNYFNHARDHKRERFVAIPKMTKKLPHKYSFQLSKIGMDLWLINRKNGRSFKLDFNGSL